VNVIKPDYTPVRGGTHICPKRNFLKAEIF
jgi:hypothetical protein